MSDAGIRVDYHGTPPQLADQASALFDDYAFGRYCADWSLPLDGARSLEREALRALMARDDAVVFAAHAADSNTLVGILAAQRSDWDTEFWGVEYFTVDAIRVVGVDEAEREAVAFALVEAFDTWSAGAGVGFANVRIETMDLAVVHAAERCGFRFIETTLANSLDLRKATFTLPAGYEIRAPLASERDVLVDMTTDAFVTHRFYADPGFPTAKVDEMYRRWVESSLDSSAWTTIVLDFEGVPHGFFIYRVDDLRDTVGVRIAKWRMGVLGVESRARGHGVALFEGAMDYASTEAEIVDSGLSLRNLKSFNLHSKLGFRANAFSATYHKWYETGADGR